MNKDNSKKKKLDEKIYYCQYCKKPVAKQVLLDDGTTPFEDIKSNQMYYEEFGFKFICLDCSRKLDI